MKCLFFALLISFSASTVSAQDIIMDEDPSTNYEKTKGPDEKHYTHAYMAFGFLSNHDQLQGAEIKMPNSFGMMFGMRYKLKVLSFYAIGFDASYRYQKYCINNQTLEEDAMNPFSTHRGSDKQRLNINSLGLEIYNRLKAGRGSNLGYYIDAGIRGEWNYSNKLGIIKKYETIDYPAGRVKQTDRNLDYIRKTALTATGRIGFKKTIIYGNYRLSDLITEAYTTPELPRLEVGIQRAF